MLTTEQVHDFNARGVLNIGQVASEADCARLMEDMYRAAAGEGDRAPVRVGNMTGDHAAQVIQIVNMWQASDAFFAHAKIPCVTDAIAQLTRSDLIRVWHDQVQCKPATSGGPTTWHPDWPLWPIITPADLITAWVPLQDVTVENGCMWMVPGSHKWGDQQAYLGTGDAFEAVNRDRSQLPEGADLKAVPIEVQRGECHLYHCLTWHGSRHNRTDQPRAAIAVHYMPEHIRYEPRGTHVMEPYVEVGEGEILRGAAFPLVRGEAVE